MCVLFESLFRLVSMLIQQHQLYAESKRKIFSLKPFFRINSMIPIEVNIVIIVAVAMYSWIESARLFFITLRIFSLSFSIPKKICLSSVAFIWRSLCWLCTLIYVARKSIPRFEKVLMLLIYYDNNDNKFRHLVTKFQLLRLITLADWLEPRTFLALLIYSDNKYHI